MDDRHPAKLRVFITPSSSAADSVQITNSREVPNVRLGYPPNCHRFAFIAPAEQEGHDRRIFECLICNHIETHVVEFRQT
jgi:hypothetical protein